MRDQADCHRRVACLFQIIYKEELAAGRDPTAESSLFARLFVPDAFHPSRLGSYLAACTFALVLLAGQPVAVVEASIAVLPSESCAHDESLRNQFGAEWTPASISDADAKRLRHAARRAKRARTQPCDAACPALPSRLRFRLLVREGVRGR